jgi:hypothetical protein
MIISWSGLREAFIGLSINQGFILISMPSFPRRRGSILLLAKSPMDSRFRGNDGNKSDALS